MGIDFKKLLKLRLVVARYGEMDGARWWNTDGVLGRKGNLLLSRGFHNTSHFAQARLVFEVARARSKERFPAVPGCITLWNLPADLEDQFDAHWSDWIDDKEGWDPFFKVLQHLDADLMDELKGRGLINVDQESEVRTMRCGADARSVSIPGVQALNDHTIALLAAGFAHSEVGKPAIPYGRMDD